jgi:hypothetical protein
MSISAGEHLVPLLSSALTACKLCPTPLELSVIVASPSWMGHLYACCSSLVPHAEGKGAETWPIEPSYYIAQDRTKPSGNWLESAICTS